MQEQSLKTPSLKLTIITLFLVLFIDGLAQGIIIPILTNTLVSTHAHELVNHLSSAARNILYGVVMSAFFLTWFIGAPIFSNLSDSIGRKKALLICLTGSAVGFLLTGFAFLFHSIALIIIGRIVGGFTTGSQPIAQAAIIDRCDPDKQAGTMALIILAVSLGMIIGPFIGGFMSDPTIVSWFTETTPLYFATGLTILNTLLLIVSFHDVNTTHKAFRFNLTDALAIFKSAFTHTGVKRLTIIFFCVSLGWAVYFVYTSPYLATRYALTGANNAYFMLMLGVGASIGFLSAGKFENRFAPKHIFLTGYSVLAVCIVLTLLIPSPLIAWLLAIPGVTGLALGYAFILRLFSKQVGSDKQGWIMGISSCIFPLAATLVSFLTGFIASIDPALPLIFAVFFIGLGCSLMALWPISEQA